MNFIRPISISLSPNTEKDDVWLAFKLLFQPWRWKQFENVSRTDELEEEFKRYLGVKYAVSFNSARSAFLAILKSLNLEKNDEVLLQAFTCNAAVNPIVWAGLKPVYVDCDDGSTGSPFNIDVEDLKRKITEKSKAVIVQHTFGLSADLDEILEVCQQGDEAKASSSRFADARAVDELRSSSRFADARAVDELRSSSRFADARVNNLILIEDCAHSLGAEYMGRKVGTFGRAAFFSFSRDKVLSSVYGGMAVTNDEGLAEKIKDFQEKIDDPSNFWIFQQLLHPILMNWLILPTYRFLGKYLLILFQWLHLLSKAVHWKEKRGIKPGYFPKRLPSALACLALNQFKKLNRFNRHRREIADFYEKELSNTKYQIQDTRYKEDNIFLRFSVRHPDAHQIIRRAWSKNLLIGDWYTTPIAPCDTKLEKMEYRMGSCPKAEKLSKEVFNLPTHINISQKEAQKIIDFIKQYENSRNNR